MYLYFHHLLFHSSKWKKRIAKKVIDENGLLWYSLDVLEQARLLLWAGDTEAAEQRFSVFYPQIESFNNLSSTVINPEIEEYLYDIYTCQKTKPSFPTEFAEKIFQYKAYVSLHYTSPAAAVEV